MARNESEHADRDQLDVEPVEAGTAEGTGSDNAADTDQFFADRSGQGERASNAGERSPDERVAEAEKEALRARAEMENFRKRMQRDLEQQIKYANLPLVRDLLEVWDNLQRAMGAAEGENPSTKALREGVAMVSQQMTDVLSRYGCRRIDALGETFDPNVHEAISQMSSDEYESGKVMNEVAVGYLLHDRVVRPSQVIVSTGPANQK